MRSAGSESRSSEWLDALAQEFQWLAEAARREHSKDLEPLGYLQGFEDGFYFAMRAATRRVGCMSWLAPATEGENAGLRRLLKQAEWRIIEHHSASIMREEHDSCPICEKDGMALLNEISKMLRADTGNSPNGRTQPPR